MTFEEWKRKEILLGYLDMGKQHRKNSRVWPYARVGWGVRYINIGSGVHENLLTMDEYLHKAYEAGISYVDVGVNNGKYQLCRRGDDGPYTVGGCAFKLFEVNAKERVDNGRATSAKCEAHHMWRGYYISPFGKFTTLEEASNRLDLAPSTIATIFDSPTNVVHTRDFKMLRLHGKNSIGKTYHELGWHFEEKDVNGNT